MINTKKIKPKNDFVSQFILDFINKLNEVKFSINAC